MWGALLAFTCFLMYTTSTVPTFIGCKEMNACTCNSQILPAHNPTGISLTLKTWFDTFTTLHTDNHTMPRIPLLLSLLISCSVCYVVQKAHRTESHDSGLQFSMPPKRYGVQGYLAVIPNPIDHFFIFYSFIGDHTMECAGRMNTSVQAKLHHCKFATNAGPFSFKGKVLQQLDVVCWLRYRANLSWKYCLQWDNCPDYENWSCQLWIDKGWQFYHGAVDKVVRMMSDTWSAAIFMCRTIIGILLSIPDRCFIFLNLFQWGSSQPEFC